MKAEKAIWLFAGGAMQELAAKKIIDRGYVLIVTDMNSNCVCSKYADEFIELDTFDIEGNLKVAQALKNKYQIKAVLTVAADCHETVAHVGKLLILPVISPQIAHICRYKNKTREVLTNSGISQPKFKIVTRINQARSFLRKIGGQGVLKATNNSGSRGFAVIKNLDDLNSDVFEKAISAGTTGTCIVEELLEPLEGQIAEQSVETLWYNGKMYWLNWVDRLFRKDFLFFNSLKADIYSNVGWGVELGHINPAIHGYKIKKDVSDLIYRAGLAIGMRNEKGGHILKADIMLTSKGPYIIELTPRLSGGWDSSKSTLVRGGDFIGGAISLALGKKLDLDLWLRYFQYKKPEIFSSVLALISDSATDCIGRKFAEGSAFERERSIKNAYSNLLEGRYVTSMEQ